MASRTPTAARLASGTRSRKRRPLANTCTKRSSKGGFMAVNTAGQAARPSPAYSNAQRATEMQRSSPQSGGDRGGPRGFLAGKGVPTSGGRADSGQGTLDRTHDQAG